MDFIKGWGYCKAPPKDFIRGWGYCKAPPKGQNQIYKIHNPEFCYKTSCK
jgi:hypothetical protein